jgi:hypothetical protein
MRKIIPCAKRSKVGQGRQAVDRTSVRRESFRVDFNEEVLVVSYGLEFEDPAVKADGAGDRSVLDGEGEVGMGCFLHMALNHLCREWALVCGDRLRYMAGVGWTILNRTSSACV